MTFFKKHSPVLRGRSSLSYSIRKKSSGSRYAVQLDSRHPLADAFSHRKASDERVALEWFVRMRELCKYWSHRQRVE